MNQRFYFAIPAYLCKTSSPRKASLTTLVFIILLTLGFIYSTVLYAHTRSSPSQSRISLSSRSNCNLFSGRWVQDPDRKPVYDETCPFHRNAWNCLKNKRDNMDIINSWKWAPQNCDLPRIDPFRFLGVMKNKRIGFVGDSLNENFVVSFLCILRVADSGAKKWKRKGAWRGAYFPKFNVIVAYHRAVLLAKYGWQQNGLVHINQSIVEGMYRVDVDTPSDDWVGITNFYDVLIFNTGHWWNNDKFPKEKPLVFYTGGQPIVPPLEMLDGLKAVLRSTVSHIQQNVPSSTFKLWRLHSPRHFYGGEWNQNGSCVFDMPLNGDQIDLWFDPSKNGVNKEARQLNLLVEEAVQGTDIMLLNLTHLSEFRADAHPAVWLGKKGAVEIWGQDCMHWCLPGVPDTWVDIMVELIYRHM